MASRGSMSTPPTDSTPKKLPPPAPVTLGGALIPQRNASASSPLVVATSPLNALVHKHAHGGAMRRGANATDAPPAFITPPKLASSNSGGSSALAAALAANPGAGPSSASAAANGAASPGAAAPNGVLSPRAGSLRVDTSKPLNGQMTPLQSAAKPPGAVVAPMSNGGLGPAALNGAGNGNGTPQVNGSSAASFAPPIDDDDEEPASEEEPDSPPDDDAKKPDFNKNDHFEFLERKTRQSVVFFNAALQGLANAGPGADAKSLAAAANGTTNGTNGALKNGPQPASGSLAPNGANGANGAPAPGAAPKKTKDELTAMERTKLAEEIVSTEKTYVDTLQFVCRGLLLRVRKSGELGRELIDPATVTKTFLNIEEIYDLHLQLFKALKVLEFERKLNGPELGAVFLKYIPFFKCYSKYVNSYAEAQTAMRKARADKPDFDFFMTVNEKCEGMRLEDYTIQPVQRVLRYVLLLKALIKTVDEKDPAHGPLSRALDAVSKVANDINASVHTHEAQLRVLDIQNHLTGDKKFELVTPTRVYIRNGPLFKFYNKKKVATQKKKYYFFLFNDAILYTTMPNSDNFCKGKHLLPLLKMELKDLPDTLEDKFMFEMTGSKKNIVVQAATSADKYQWMTQITEYINKEKAADAALKQRGKRL